MNLERAVFCDLASVNRRDLDLGALTSAVPRWQWHDNIAQPEVIDAVADADVVVSNKVMLDENILLSAKKLKLICIAATGTNNVDLKAAKALGISVCNVQGYATASVVQHVFAMLLMHVTQIKQYQQAVLKGEWCKSEHFCLFDYPIFELQGKTIGIIGYGELGRAVARAAEVFGMQVMIAKRDLNDDRDNRVPLKSLLQHCDVVSLHCPLNEQTRGLIGRNELALMKKNALLINTARGGLVDEQALYEALKANQIGGAAIDVLEKEPPECDHPLLTEPFSNLVVTPHVAWASVESRQRLMNEIAKNIVAFRLGNPRNLVEL